MFGSMLCFSEVCLRCEHLQKHSNLPILGHLPNIVPELCRCTAASLAYATYGECSIVTSVEQAEARILHASTSSELDYEQHLLQNNNLSLTLDALIDNKQVEQAL